MVFALTTVLLLGTGVILYTVLGVFVKTKTVKRPSSHVLVLLQLSFVALSCYPPGLRNTGSVVFLVLCLAGAVLGGVVLYHNRPSNFAVYPEVRAGADLVTDGPYRYVRHPMYSALMLMMIGIAGYNGHFINWAAAVALLALLDTKARREEKLLVRAFPGYAAYAEPIKRFVPLVY